MNHSFRFLCSRYSILVYLFLWGTNAHLTAQKNFTIQWLHLPVSSVKVDSNHCIIKPDLQGLPDYTVLHCHAPVALLKRADTTLLQWGEVVSILGSEPEFRFETPLTKNDFIGFWGLVPDQWRDWQATPAHILARYQVTLLNQTGETIIDPRFAIIDPIPAQLKLNTWCEQQENPALATSFTYHLAQQALDYIGTTQSVKTLYDIWLDTNFEIPTTKSPEVYTNKITMSGDGLAAGGDDLNAFRDPCPMTLSINSGTLNGMSPNAGLAEWTKRLPCYSDSIAVDSCAKLHFERYALDIHYEQGQLVFNKGYYSACDELLMATTLYWPIRRLGLPTRLLTKIETPTDIETYSTAIKEPWMIGLVYTKPYGSFALQFDNRMKVDRMILSNEAPQNLRLCE
jgi:hypothetical protein